MRITHSSPTKRQGKKTVYSDASDGYELKYNEGGVTSDISDTEALPKNVKKITV